MKKRFYLIRHGETDYNFQKKIQGKKIDPYLNENGIIQAKKLAHWLKNEKFDFIACSNMKRAIQTASIIQEVCQNVELKIFQQLHEMDFGEWDGDFFDPNQPKNRYEELQNMISKWKKGYLYEKPPKGESPVEVERRSLEVIEYILSLDVQNILIVCHGRLLKILLSSLLKKGLQNMDYIIQDNTCINILEYDHYKKEFYSILLNCTKHLYQENNYLEFIK